MFVKRIEKEKYKGRERITGGSWNEHKVKNERGVGRPRLDGSGIRRWAPGSINNTRLHRTFLTTRSMLGILVWYYL